MFDVPAALDLTREALLTAMLIAAPVLGAGIVVGICVSLLQTITQLQDQTLAIVPKIVAMIAAAVFLTPWLARRLIDYSAELFAGGS
ncbi:MAG: flagellar biosynthetic protein FliQ [Phycisphaerae bacterium]|jgi:flagellar biosynthetic protein FliQ